MFLSVLFHAAVDFLAGFLARKAIFPLQRAGNFIHLALDAIKVDVGEVVPPFFGLTAYIFCLALKNVIFDG